MKLFHYIVLFIMLLFVSKLIGEITNSHHDFQSMSNTNGRICIACHTPHNADTQISDAPLWNHEITVASYTLYSTSTINSTINQPDGLSKLCLSCHDGTVAVDNHSGETGGTYFIRAQGQVGPDLTSEHPISFTYDAALATADGDLHDPTTQSSGLGSTIDVDLLFNGKMECSSCHDVHIARNTNGCMGCHFVGPYTTRSLSIRIDNDNSALCLTCHKK